MFLIGCIVSVTLSKGRAAEKVTFCGTVFCSLNDEDETVNGGVTGDKVIRFDGGYKRVHLRVEGIEGKIIV